jgi:hypothetical protein
MLGSARTPEEHVGDVARCLPHRANVRLLLLIVVCSDIFFPVQVASNRVVATRAGQDVRAA